MKLTFLGTSTSVGIPVIGCDCATCCSDDPKDKRMRSSVLVETDSCTVLVDTGPDLRFQSLRQNLRSVDAVFYTHAHLDHVAGFDELRAFCWARDEALPLYGNAECLKALEMMYPWAFSPDNVFRNYVRPEARVIDKAIEFCKLTITPLPVIHSSVKTIGYRFDYKNTSIVYIPDVKEIPSETLPLLYNADHLIIDALREKEHPTHMSIDEALKVIAKVSPKNAWLTHISHETDYKKLESTLPKHVSFAYDSLSIS